MLVALEVAVDEGVNVELGECVLLKVGVGDVLRVTDWVDVCVSLEV